MLRRQLRISARVSPSPVIIIAERALLSFFFSFPLGFHTFFYIYPPLPFSRSIHRPACLSEAGYNVTSLIIGVVKRVVRNNYEPATPSVPCGRRRCVTRALSTPRYWPRRGQFQVSRVLILQNQTSAGRRAVRLKNKRANYVSTD